MLELELIGHLGQDPEMRYTPGGDSVTSFSVACLVGRDKTQWVRASCWGKLAELANEHLAKGKQVFIRGRPRINEYVDREGLRLISCGSCRRRRRRRMAMRTVGNNTTMSVPTTASTVPVPKPKRRRSRTRRPQADPVLRRGDAARDQRCELAHLKAIRGA